MTGKLYTEKNAVHDVLQRFTMFEMIPKEDIVDHHRRGQQHEEKDDGKKDTGQLSLFTFPIGAACRAFRWLDR